MNDAIPHPTVCEQARLSRDARFDGLFFTAVTTTGIYCRPVCAAPAPRPRNVTYFAHAAAAEAAGFRPCLRCRPELAPGATAWRRGDEVVARALAIIDEGDIEDAPLAVLARRMHLGERQLRRLFVQRIGVPPVAVQGTRRLLLAKQLLSDTSLPITDVAMAAGFGSLRRFNAVFRDAYRMAPRDLRRSEGVARDQVLTLRLGYRPPYDFDAMLDFLRVRALPGVEIVDACSYARLFGGTATPGWLRVSQWPERGAQKPVHALRLELHGSRPATLLSLVSRVRRMFDLDAEPGAIGQTLRRDPRLAPLVDKRPGLRLPGGWDGFEMAVRAVLGQQVSVPAARTLAARLVERFGTPLPDPSAAQGFGPAFPTAGALVDADLTGIGLTRDRATTLRAVARAVVERRADFGPEHTLDAFVAAWTALPGIGPWTAQYIAMRALHHPDAFPAEDLVLQKALRGDGSRMTTSSLRHHAEAWRPWRAYAVVHLWHEATTTAATRRPTTRTTR